MTYRLNGQFLAVGAKLAGPAGLTVARWQVLSAIMRQPLPVAGIARAMGLTRQSVQRVADRLVDDGLAEYLPNPAHRRAQLVRPTNSGYSAVRDIDPALAAFAKRVTAVMGTDGLAGALAAMTALSQVLEELEEQ
ncbi:MAG: MarR family winged helix-turn-helix transcriptional regulator [Stackebrandtia sp.]